MQSWISSIIISSSVSHKSMWPLMTPVFIYFSYFIKNNEDISDWKQNFFVSLKE